MSSGTDGVALTVESPEIAAGLGPKGAVTGDLTGYPAAGHLAAHAGIATVTDDSGAARTTCTGRASTTDGCAASSTSQPKPRCADRGITTSRNEGEIHSQTVLCLARRRIDVLWAMLRDQRPYVEAPPLPNAA